MFPELFEVPFTDLTVKSYGLLMVIGFLLAVYVIRRLSRDITPDPQLITNAALYSLIAGVLGARLFYVIHYIENFKDNPLSVFAIWEGGLELLGGVILAITVIALYLRYHKLPIRKYLDILAIGLFIALTFGRLGCLMNGCCFGKPTNCPVAIRFPYDSIPFRSQIFSDVKRDRIEPHLELPHDYFGMIDAEGVQVYDLKPFDQLTPDQQQQVTTGPYRCLPVHPSQIYSSINALLCAFLLYLFWRKGQKGNFAFIKPGCTFGMMLILYGFGRFFLEFMRDDNPFESAWWIILKGKTVSQNLGIYLIVIGALLIALFSKMRPPAANTKKQA
jgi:phosphatidylglycerol:prolipoprotein diacylglycerol transferase